MTTGAVVVVLTAAGCGDDAPKLPRAPSASSLAASGDSVGVPYGRWIACRVDGRPVAVELQPESSLGDRVKWRWQWLEPPAEGPPAASGITVERHGLGTIRIGGRSLEWSRGSPANGWLYWPPEPVELELYSRPFANLDDTRQPEGGVWLRRSMFTRE